MRLISGILTIGFLVGWLNMAYSQISFSDFFTGRMLRFDFLLAGDQQTARVIPVHIKKEQHWGGSETNLLDPFEYGNYRFRVYDDASGKLIFSRGFSTLFQEWQTTPEAKTRERAYHQALFFPFPKKAVNLRIDWRNRAGHFDSLYQTEIDPSDIFISHESPGKSEVFRISGNNSPGKAVDLAFLSEGYTRWEQEKFMEDVKRLGNAFLSVAPFSHSREKFNISAVFVPSDESGTDIPGEHIYVNTRFNSSFYTFGTDRYLTVSDMKPVYDAAATVPWDQLVVLVNTSRYGGGGIYNLVTVCTSDHELSPKVLVHELGHAFAGLADEYYTSGVAYENFYNTEVEPWEPNITTLVNFGSKWKPMVDNSTPVPTPRTLQYESVTGVFEGGGYMAKGIYSPRQDCLMKSNRTERFCPVCQEAILKAIEWQTSTLNFQAD
jgi:hypothetical protein